MKIICNLLSLVLLTLPAVLLAQTTLPDKVQKGNKTLINVPVIVSDREGRRISGLEKKDFVLYQGGVKQNITSFATEDEPMSVALLLDTSGSTQQVLDKIKNAAKDFIELLNPGDKCLIATFDSQVNIITPFTSDRKELKKALDKIQTAEREGTVMFSAIDQIAQNSFRKVQGRKAIVLLSDGKDFGSAVSRKDLLNELEESDISIYAIFYQSGIGFNKPVINSSGTVEEGKEIKKPKKEKKRKIKKKGYTILIPLPGDEYTKEEIKILDKTATTEAIASLKQLSDITTGRFYLSDAKLSLIFKQVASEMRQQYLLGFYLENAAHNTVIRDISVKVDRPNVVVHARTRFHSKEL